MARKTSCIPAIVRGGVPARIICRHICHHLWRMMPLILFALLGALVLRPSHPVSSQTTLPAGFTETLVTGDLTLPTAMAQTPDGRIFICLQGGQLRVLKNGALLPTPFLTLSVSQQGERGLLGVAIDPDFVTNQFIYVYYTLPSAPVRNRVSRFTANGDVAAANSETILLTLDEVFESNYHNGGALHFGPDKKLYIATGENTITSHAQTLGNMLGKILRINPNGTIPADNPFYNQAAGNNRSIWALGLRNPFTFAFQPGTGRMFINDVGSGGSNVVEEINDGIAGANYGWPACEGNCSPANPAYRNPLYAYPHTNNACAITGGVFYNPATVQFPAEYVGGYFFADYCAGWIRRFNPANGSVVNFATVRWPVNMLVSPDGSLYYFSFWDSKLFRIQYAATNQPPQIVSHPAPRTVAAGQPASFTVSASGTPALSYQWQRNGTNIGGATSATYTIAATAASDNGAKFRCVVSNSFGSATSNEATLTVASNQPPVAAITTPAAGTLYQGGQTINYAGTGTDPETGALPASAFTWRVDFHHDVHFHPFVPATSGAAGGSAVIPTIGETAANVWYRIHLTVTDPNGLSNSVYRDVLPRVSTITLQTSPAGLGLTLDGSPAATPAAVQSVAGIIRALGAVSPQTAGGVTYVFSSWSDGGAASHTISTPTANTTYTATFAACSPAIAPASQPVAAACGTGAVSVTAAAGCAWTAASNASWITLTAGATGSGNGSVTFTAAKNPDNAMRSGTLTIAGRQVTIVQPPPVTSVSAASFGGSALATESIAAAFGSGLAKSTMVATTRPLPTMLGGTKVNVRDSAGVERLAPLFFVSPSQINYQVPPGTAAGAALVTVVTEDVLVAGDSAQIALVAPGLFSANASGRGLLTGLALRVKADGTRGYEQIVQFNQQTQQMTAAPIDLGPATDQVFLILFATGARFRSSLGAVSVRIGGINADPLFAGPQGEFIGLDQFNVALPRSLAGRGEMDVTVSVDGVAANSLRIAVK